MRDRVILFAAAFLRAFAIGMTGVLLGIYLAKLELGPGPVGLIIGVGLAGSALAALAATLFADRMGRRTFLRGLSILAIGGGVGAALGSTPLGLGAVAFFGMLNGMGRDRGAALVIETAILPATTPDSERTRVFAWYNVLQDLGHALGSLAAGLPAILRRSTGMAELPALRVGMALYAAVLLCVLLLYLGLSPAVEVRSRSSRRPLSPHSRRVLWKISSLFALDSLGGGLMTTAMLAFFFYQRFGVDEATIGPLFFAARVANALSHLGAAWLARRIGLVNTMVWTHIPSSLLLVTVAFAPSFAIAALLFVLREGLVEMDVPTRQSYVMAVVRPDERTFAAGVTTLVRVGAWAVAPMAAGLLLGDMPLVVPLLVGTAVKVIYDVLLWLSFRGLRPPEEVS